MSLFKTIGNKIFKTLLADPQGAVQVALPILPGQGLLTAGCLLYKNGGMWQAATTSQMSSSYALAVLAEDVDTDANLLVAEDAAAFIAGQIARKAVFFKAGSDMTDAYELLLRQQGILLTPVNGDAGGVNSRVKITYLGNNATEEEYDAYEVKGATHTVLANTVTGFTAPDGKTFSKWNTKDDGSGTDYSAAASYTASADLTLYAVWANSVG